MLGGLLGPQDSGVVQQAAMTGLGATGDEAVPGVVLGNWAALTPGARAVALEMLQSREGWALALLEAVAEGGVVTLDATRRARLLQHGSSRVRELAERTLSVPSSRAEAMAHFRPALRLAGEAARGRPVFERLCVSCHKIGGVGGEVGPDLSTVAGHAPEKLLANILDPSADVQPGFHAYDCELADGRELYGLIVAETGNSLTLKSADGAVETVRRQEIRSLRGGGRSLMPDGLEAGLSPQDMADLLQLLRSQGAR